MAVVKIFLFFISAMYSIALFIKSLLKITSVYIKKLAFKILKSDAKIFV